MVNSTRTILAEASVQFLADLSERIRLADDTAELLGAVAQAIGEYLQRFYRLDIQLIFEADESFFNFPSEVSIALIRTTQEALMNVRKHAQTDYAFIRLGQTMNYWRIRVEDEGRGFDLGQITTEKIMSYGIKIMRERMEAVGGHLEIESAPGQGTRITLFYPRG